MPFDNHRNLAISTVATAPSPATSGLTLTLATGEGARMPAVPFNATVWPASTLPTPVSAEIVRVTAMTGDAITAMTRAQEGTVARAIVVGDLFAATITVKALTDVESGVNFPQITTPGNVNVGAGVAATPQIIFESTAPGGGFLTFKRAATVDAYVGSASVVGSTAPIGLSIDTKGALAFLCNTVERGRIHASGGFSWGGIVDPGVGNFSVTGKIVLGAASSITTNTTDGADNTYLSIGGGGSGHLSRGANIDLFGNEFAGAPGVARLWAGDVAGGQIEFYTGPALERGRMHRSGGFSWASVTDPGPGNWAVNGQTFMGRSSNIVYPAPLAMTFAPATGPGIAIAPTVDASGGSYLLFHNAATNIQGSIASPTPTTTAYNTSSDQRLKRDRGLVTETDVLRRTRVHDFDWLTDGIRARGVFAQEAATVLPAAIMVGTDALDDAGLPRHPWMTDYSKYVPDLIVGWQQHDGQVEALTARIEALETALARRPAVDGPSLFAIVVDRLRGWLARLPPLLPVKA